MSAPVAIRAAPVRTRYRVPRITLPGVLPGRLYFAQVREDPLLEIEALVPARDDVVVVVGSGGCTALSLLAAGAGRVIAVDSNSTQTSIVELKAAAVTALGTSQAVSFLGGSSMEGRKRRRIYSTLSRFMSSAATACWNSNLAMIERGVLNAGVSERFIALVAGVLRKCVQPRERIERLLACTSLPEQRELYHSEWNNRRWRLLFDLMLNRWAFNRTYEPGFFANVANPSFAAHFRGLLEHALCEVPVATNYFLHHMLTGAYPAGVPRGVPPYLDKSDNDTSRSGALGLELVDGRYQDYLASCADSSVDGFALSNICEWLTAPEVSDLFAQVIRVARPGARVCFRNFVGHTEVPERLKDILVEDAEWGRAAILRDRSCLQARIAICTVEK
ncbi:MAG: DUF3419 family protein [Gemmatimonadaceae bacterium]|nr:DUF3419 family protein [Gemmatimonadaceae bacterium]